MDANITFVAAAAKTRAVSRNTASALSTLLPALLRCVHMYVYYIYMYMSMTHSLEMCDAVVRDTSNSLETRLTHPKHVCSASAVTAKTTNRRRATRAMEARCQHPRNAKLAPCTISKSLKYVLSSCVSACILVRIIALLFLVV